MALVFTARHHIKINNSSSVTSVHPKTPSAPEKDRGLTHGVHTHTHTGASKPNKALIVYVTKGNPFTGLCFVLSGCFVLRSPALPFAPCPVSSSLPLPPSPTNFCSPAARKHSVRGLFFKLSECLSERFHKHLCIHAERTKERPAGVLTRRRPHSLQQHHLTHKHTQTHMEMARCKCTSEIGKVKARASV